jgi:cation transport ATPase
VALVLREGEAAAPTPVEEIARGSEVLVRHGEVLPLDGELLSERALVDESSLTGEPYLLDKVHGDQVRSGTVNQGPPLRLRVLREARDSTYRRILELVESAQASSAPMARLADRYSLVFSAVAIALAAGAWWSSGSLERALAVLDKTGTITVGRPQLVRIECAADGAIDSDQLLCLTPAVERHSLHPIAKSLVEAAQARSLPLLEVQDVTETTGQGISATVGSRGVVVRGGPGADGQMRVVCEVDGEVASTFALEDGLKPDAREIFEKILNLGVQMAIATGDRRNAAERVVHELGLPLEVDAECTPASKLELIRQRQADGQVVGMVGDGINDAPALAQADVGLVFTHEARTASSEAADIVLLGGELRQVWQSLWIARQTIRVATQGILLGIGLSVVAMLVAAAGYLPPLAGALLQEGIDVLVIANALRATRGQ